jgi:hypothetical protein
MESFDTLLLMRMAERLLGLLAGVLSVVLGYRLFVRLPEKTDSSGKVVLPGGVVPEALFVVVAGNAVVDGASAPVVFDAPGLLFGLAARAEHAAGPDGLEALVIAKPHVFTIARECPEFVVGLRDLADGGRA